MRSYIPFFVSALILFISNNAYGQYSDRSIPTAMSFLLTRPDARSSGMGDVGAATPVDAYSLYSNASKIAFSSNKTELGLSYVPLMPYLTDDVNLANFSGFRKTGEKGFLGFSLYYLSYGQIDGFDANQNPTGAIFPKEYTLDLTYARKMSNHFSLGLSARYLHSDIYDGHSSNGLVVDPSNAFAVDVSAYFEKEHLGGATGAKWALGALISNIGTKVKYAAGNNEFLPTNLKIGGSYSLLVDGSTQRLSFAADFNKLLVPSPPVYDNNGNIVDGKDPNRSVVSALFSSFGDAPGGFAEELKEISAGAGIEYLFDETFAFRTGYFYEHQDKGDRQHFSLGTGARYRNFSFDLAYIVPTANRYVLKNTIKFSLGMSLN